MGVVMLPLKEQRLRNEARHPRATPALRLQAPWLTTMKLIATTIPRPSGRRLEGRAMAASDPRAARSPVSGVWHSDAGPSAPAAQFHGVCVLCCVSWRSQLGPRCLPLRCGA